MKTKEQLIRLYEIQLEKVEKQFGNSCMHTEYVDFAKSELEAVKNGRNW